MQIPIRPRPKLLKLSQPTNNNRLQLKPKLSQLTNNRLLLINKLLELINNNKLLLNSLLLRPNQLQQRLPPLYKLLLNKLQLLPKLKL